MMEKPIEISFMTLGEETEISELVIKVFDEFVAPEFTPEGIENFLSYANPERIRSDFEKGNTILVARHSGAIRGVLEIREGSHICLLFVDRPFHKQGIATKLWREAKRICLDSDPSISEFTVHSSTYAIPVYEKLGFSKNGEKQCRDGIVFTPMKSVP